MLVVVALVVEALEVMKLELLPKRVVIYALRAFKIFAKSVPPTFRFVIEEEACVVVAKVEVAVEEIPPVVVKVPATVKPAPTFNVPPPDISITAKAEDEAVKRTSCFDFLRDYFIVLILH